MHECSLGCGNAAILQLKNGNWSCSKNVSGCPAIKRRKAESMIERWGVDNPSRSSEVRTRRVQTWIKKYGVDNPSKDPSIHAKNQTSLVNRGTMYPLQSAACVSKLKESWAGKTADEIKEIRSKIENTNMSRYGVPHALQNETVALKSRRSWKNKTAEELSDIICKRRTTNLLKYGVDNPSKAPDVIHKIIEKLIARIGHSRSSKSEMRWLDSLGIEGLKRQHPIRFKGHRLMLVDGYDPATNTAYEFLGDYWHGNPKLYESSALNKTAGKTFGELYQQTMLRLDLLKEKGYNVIAVWESDV
jgi:hypothetical protein